MRMPTNNEDAGRAISPILSAAHATWSLLHVATHAPRYRTPTYARHFSYCYCCGCCMLDGQPIGIWHSSTGRSDAALPYTGRYLSPHSLIHRCTTHRRRHDVGWLRPWLVGWLVVTRDGHGSRFLDSTRPTVQVTKPNLTQQKYCFRNCFPT